MPRTLLALLGRTAALFLLACAGPEGGRGAEPGSASALFAPAREHGPRESPIDVEHYALALELDPAGRSIAGTCRVRLWAAREPQATVALDLVGLAVASVHDERGTALDFTHADGVLGIELARPLVPGDFTELAILYSGVPRKGLYFSGERAGLPTQVFTQGECLDSRWWFPCLDDPADRATSELEVSLPAGWQAVAAGERLEREALPDGRSRERWRMSTPHPPYLTTLVAGELAVVEDEWRGVPLVYLAEARYADWLDEGFAETGAALEFLSELTGVPYPYPKYSQACVENFPFGGMENVSATTMTDTMLLDARGYRDWEPHGLVVHEAAHQWFGDLLTCRDWAHIWLNEGWATYATLLYEETRRGADDFQVALREAQAAYLAGEDASPRPIVHGVYRYPMELFGTGHAYPGAAVRLHLLRWVVGDQAFFRGVRRYVGENQGRSVTTADFRVAMESASQLDLGRFFEQWFHSPGYPVFEFRWEWHAERQVVHASVRQVHEGQGTPACFQVPIEIEVQAGGKTLRQRFELERREQVFELPSFQRPSWVRFDPDDWIPKRLDTDKLPEEWLAIARDCPDVNARCDAVCALARLAAGVAGGRKDEQALEALDERLRLDTAPAVRIAVAQGVASRAALLEAARSDPTPAVRAAALRALAKLGPGDELEALGRGAFEEGQSWQVMAAAAELVAAAHPAEARAFLIEALEIDSPHDVLREQLLTTLAGLDGEGVVDDLAAWAFDPTASPHARAAAVRALGTRGRAHTAVRRKLVELLDTPWYHLRSDVIEALGALDDPRAVRALVEWYPRCVDDRQRRAVEKIVRASRAGT
jgi:aminopeptidase N